MARQSGDIKITGTIEDICFYKMDGNYYVRMKSSLTAKKFWKSKAFEGSRKSCKRFSMANKLASQAYRMVAKEKRAYSLFCFLRTKAIHYLKRGLEQKEVLKILQAYLPGFKIKKLKNSPATITRRKEGLPVRFTETPLVFAIDLRTHRCRTYAPV